MPKKWSRKLAHLARNRTPSRGCTILQPRAPSAPSPSPTRPHLPPAVLSAFSSFELSLTTASQTGSLDSGSLHFPRSMHTAQRGISHPLRSLLRTPHPVARQNTHHRHYRVTEPTYSSGSARNDHKITHDKQQRNKSSISLRIQYPQSGTK
jgi:hypothetical protein